MSSTRYAQGDRAMRQERFASAPEFDELRGISAVATAARAALLNDPSSRELIWWLQALSLQPGTLKRLAADLLENFPDRIGSPSMHSEFRKLEVFTGENLYRIYQEIEPGKARSIQMSKSAKRAAALSRAAGMDVRDCPGCERSDEQVSRRQLIARCRQSILDRFEEFAVELCVNPAVPLSPAAFPFFDDVIEVLDACKQQFEKSERDIFVLTEIGRQVWDTLDYGIERRGMVLIEGLEGRGKSEAAKAWCRGNAGRARYVALKGITGKWNVFRAIAKALGIGAGYGYKSNELQNRIEDVLCRSGIMLVIDEAHWLFDFKPRMYSRPVMVDWINTALANESVPVALVTTQQFLQCAQQAGEQVNWNWRQWRRRVKRFKVLPECNSDSDLTLVAKKLLPGATNSAIKLAVGYSKLRKLDVSGLGDIGEEAKLVAQRAGREKVQFEDIDCAINELAPSDAAFASRLQTRNSEKIIPEPPEIPDSQNTFENSRQCQTRPASSTQTNRLQFNSAELTH